MKSDEVRIAEAVAALRTRLESWGVDDAAEKAQTYVTDMLRNGWRPKSLPVEVPPKPTRPATDVSSHIAAARAALRKPQPTPTDPTEETDCD